MKYCCILHGRVCVMAYIIASISLPQNSKRFVSCKSESVSSDSISISQRKLTTIIEIEKLLYVLEISSGVIVYPHFIDMCV